MAKPPRSFLFHVGELFIFVSFLVLCYIAASWLVDVAFFDGVSAQGALRLCLEDACVSFLDADQRERYAISTSLIVVVGLLFRAVWHYAWRDHDSFE
ncbi:MAG: hypothetical protein ACLFWF_07205 [Alphaproteobacteria bacterium]